MYFRSVARSVTLPLISSVTAQFAGGLLAFALSFDEIVVTTLPLVLHSQNGLVATLDF
jgi:ABC-type spermidine/putrescine transport system permease subunit II